MDTQRVYWANYNALFSMPLAGGAILPLVDEGVQLELDSIALDATHIYWTRLGPVQQPITGGKAIMLGGISGSGPGRIAVDDANVYWTIGPIPCDVVPCGHRHDGAVMKVSLAGGTSVKLAAFETPCYPVTQLAVDADHVYWTSAHELQRTPLGGGPIETLASNEGDPYAMVLGPTDVYWACGRSMASRRLSERSQSSASLATASRTRTSAGARAR